MSVHVFKNNDSKIQKHPPTLIHKSKEVCAFISVADLVAFYSEYCFIFCAASWKTRLL